jgi:uncharacterized protein YidB (DUF937 family)
MGLLDNIKSETAGFVSQLTGNHPRLAREVMVLVNNPEGGLAGLIQRFESNGCGQIVSSWVGTGPNAAISGAQIQQALGSDQVRQLATRVGLDPDVVSQRLATILPQVVDQLTPNGQLPNGGSIVAIPISGVAD